MLLALSSQVLGWLLISVSLPRLPAVLTSIVLMLQPVCTVFLGAVLLSEAPRSRPAGRRGDRDRRRGGRDGAAARARAGSRLDAPCRPAWRVTDCPLPQALWRVAIGLASRSADPQAFSSTWRTNDLAGAAEELLAHSADDVVFEPHAAHGQEIRGHDALREFWARFERTRGGSCERARIRSPRRATPSSSAAGSGPSTRAGSPTRSRAGSTASTTRTEVVSARVERVLGRGLASAPPRRPAAARAARRRSRTRARARGRRRGSCGRRAPDTIAASSRSQRSAEMRATQPRPYGCASSACGARRSSGLSSTSVPLTGEPTATVRLERPADGRERLAQVHAIDRPVLDLGRVPEHLAERCGHARPWRCRPRSAPTRACPRGTAGRRGGRSARTGQWRTRRSRPRREPACLARTERLAALRRTRSARGRRPARRAQASSAP